MDKENKQPNTAPETMTPKLEKMIAGVEKEIKAGEVSKIYSDAENFVQALKE